MEQNKNPVDFTASAAFVFLLTKLRLGMVISPTRWGTRVRGRVQVMHPPPRPVPVIYLYINIYY